MKIVYEYSHLGGTEILKVRYPEIEKEIYDVILKVIAKKSKISKEKTMKGKRLYAPSDMNRQFKEYFSIKGYKELKDTYTISIPNNDVIIKGAFKQIDFVKDNVLVEVQFGKYAFVAYDLY